MDSSGILLDSEVLRRSPSYKYKFYPLSNLSVASSGLGTLLFIAMLGSGVPGEAGVSVPSEAPFLEGTTWPTLRSPPTNSTDYTGEIRPSLSHLLGNLSLGGLPKPNPFSVA